MKSFRRKGLLLLLLMGLSALISLFYTNCSPKGFKATALDNSAEDPMMGMAWHIWNTGQNVFASRGGKVGVDLNLSQTWLSEISGQGVKVLISDDGVEDAHEDLQANYLYGGVSRDYTKASPYTSNTSAPTAVDDNHGTSVAGLVAAMAMNGKGARGVAPQASIISANFLSSAVTQSEAILVHQASGSFDIFNMSWGAKQNNLVRTVASFQQQLRTGALSGRSGKGSI